MISKIVEVSGTEAYISLNNTKSLDYVELCYILFGTVGFFLYCIVDWG